MAGAVSGEEVYAAGIAARCVKAASNPAPFEYQAPRRSDFGGAGSPGRSPARSPVRSRRRPRQRR
jgi:hypothetical protein